MHAVAGILEDVGIPFVTDIPAVDGFSTIVSIVSSLLPTFRYCAIAVVSAVAFVSAHVIVPDIVWRPSLQ